MLLIAFSLVFIPAIELSNFDGLLFIVPLTVIHISIDSLFLIPSAFLLPTFEAGKLERSVTLFLQGLCLVLLMGLTPLFFYFSDSEFRRSSFLPRS